jgi:hypothetical protein
MFMKAPNIKFQGNSSSQSRTGRQTDVSKKIGTLRDSAKANKKHSHVIVTKSTFKIFIHFNVVKMPNKIKFGTHSFIYNLIITLSIFLTIKIV